MRLRSIGNHLRPYVMVARRRTTINHAFAAAVAPSDNYDEERLREAVRILGLDPDHDLACAYCGALAETWDHVFATVRQSRFSGHGHTLGNLLPCCKPCNSRKGNKPWDAHLNSLGLEPAQRASRAEAISKYLETYAVYDSVVMDTPDIQRLEEIRKQVLSLLEEGDRVARRVRADWALP